jgi:NAD(P) transhydrogenase
MGRLHAVIDQQVSQVQGNLGRHGVTVHQGQARFVGPNELVVERDGARWRALRGSAFLVATGSSPYRPRACPSPIPTSRTRTPSSISTASRTRWR